MDRMRMTCKTGDLAGKLLKILMSALPFLKLDLPKKKFELFLVNWTFQLGISLLCPAWLPVSLMANRSRLNGLIELMVEKNFFALISFRMFAFGIISR